MSVLDGLHVTYHPREPFTSSNDNGCLIQVPLRQSPLTRRAKWPCLVSEGSLSIPKPNSPHGNVTYAWGLAPVCFVVSRTAKPTELIWIWVILMSTVPFAPPGSMGILFLIYMFAVWWCFVVVVSLIWTCFC